MNAFIMRKKLNKKRNKNNFIVYEDGSSILFDYKYNEIEDRKQLYDSIMLIEVRGSLSDKKEEQLIKLVCDSHLTVGEMLLNSSDNIDSFLDNYKDEEKIELNIDNTQNTIDNNYFIEDLTSQRKKKIKKR